MRTSRGKVFLAQAKSDEGRLVGWSSEGGGGTKTCFDAFAPWMLLVDAFFQLNVLPVHQFEWSGSSAGCGCDSGMVKWSQGSPFGLLGQDT